MKNKKLLTALIFAATATLTAASDGTPPGGDGRTVNGSQQVVVNNYYHESGYEYASRLKRFHTSYVTFDFYSPVFTETYWYRYTPYTWGVSIYDDWYYYGAGASQSAWRSGYGGSYWWGYDQWRGYNPWMGNGWSSWYGAGISYSVNFYLGRPHYHYPVACNSWNSYRYGNYNSSVTVINNNTYNYYYGSERRSSYQGGSTGYNPSDANSSVRRSGYTSTGGRSSASGTAPAASGSDGTQPGTQSRSQSGSQSRTQTGNQGRTQSGSQGRTQSGTRSQTQTGNQGQAQTGNQGRTQTDNTPDAQSDSDKDKSNNGLRMGQYRRGVAEPAEPGDNGLPRTNNPNVDDRTDPGREQDNATRSSGDQKVSTDRAPARAMPRRQVQTMVKTATQSSEAILRKETPSGNSSQREKSAQQGSGKSTENSSEATSSGNESRKSNTSSQRKR